MTILKYLPHNLMYSVRQIKLFFWKLLRIMFTLLFISIPLQYFQIKPWWFCKIKEKNIFKIIFRFTAHIAIGCNLLLPWIRGSISPTNLCTVQTWHSESDSEEDTRLKDCGFEPRHRYTIWKWCLKATQVWVIHPVWFFLDVKNKRILGNKKQCMEKIITSNQENGDTR